MMSKMMSRVMGVQDMQCVDVSVLGNQGKASKRIEKLDWDVRV